MHKLSEFFIITYFANSLTNCIRNKRLISLTSESTGILRRFKFKLSWAREKFGTSEMRLTYPGYLEPFISQTIFTGPLEIQDNNTLPFYIEKTWN